MTASQDASPNPDAVAAVRALARASRLLERASGERNLAQYRVLAAIASGDERASRIADRLALGKPTISAAVDALCARGLLERSVVDDDKRASLLRLTGAGRQHLAEVERSLVEELAAVCARTPDPDAVVAALVQLGDAIEEATAERHAHRPDGARATTTDESHPAPGR